MQQIINKQVILLFLKAKYDSLDIIYVHIYICYKVYTDR